MNAPEILFIASPRSVGACPRNVTTALTAISPSSTSSRSAEQEAALGEAAVAGPDAQLLTPAVDGVWRACFY